MMTPNATQLNASRAAVVSAGASPRAIRRHAVRRLLLVVLPAGFLAFGAAATALQLPGSNIIPASRLVRWAPGVTVGVEGGIPGSRATCQSSSCVAVLNAGDDLRNGVTNAAPLLQAAINSAPANSVVVIPAGTWRIDSTVSIGPNRDSITLRGAGASTVLDCRAANTCLFVGSGSDYAWSWPPSGNAVTSYATDAGGGTQLTMSDTSAFSVNQLVQFSVANDPALPVISVGGYDRLRRQMTRVLAKTTQSITVFPAIYGVERFVGRAARVNVAQFQTDFVGIEDMVLDGANGAVTFGIWFEQTYGSWIKNVTVIRSSNYSVFFNDSLQCEMRHSRLDVLNHGGTNGAGLLMNTVSGCLIEDNIIRESFPNIEVNHGSSGNVIAYNFLNNGNGQIGIDTNHGPHNSFNLYEGNVAHNLMSDGYFGGNSEDTLFRNFLHGNGIAGGTLTYCLSLKRFTRNFSLVGNVLGSNSHSARCDAYGQPNIGNGGWNGTAQQSVGDYWADWRPDTGTTIRGTLTSRSDNFHGTVTLSSGSVTPGQAPALRSPDGNTFFTWVTVVAVSGNLITVDTSPWQVNLPALSTPLRLEPGAGGFQELDLDVEATTLKKANNFVPTGIPPSESLGGATLPASLYLTGKPAWFGQLAWPPFDPTAPNLSYEAIPAGYRYIRGVDPGGSLPAAPVGLRIIR
jgi:hypothetical protein